MDINDDSLLRNLLFISFFGCLGVASRFLLGLGINKLFPFDFPYGTFFINILGSLFIGCIYVAGVEKTHVSPVIKLAIMVGFFGGFTTFSSYSLESTLLIQKGKYLIAFCYFILSPITGILSTFLGILIARKLF